MKRIELERRLRRNNCYLKREGRSHFNDRDPLHGAYRVAEHLGVGATGLKAPSFN